MASLRETLLSLLVTSAVVVINAINLGKDFLGATSKSLFDSLKDYLTSTLFRATSVSLRFATSLSYFLTCLPVIHQVF